MTDALLNHQLFSQMANKHGFHLTGICRAIPSDFAVQAFLDWLNQGKAGEMDWLARRKDEKTNPQIYMQGVKSVLVVACYYTPKAAGADICMSAYTRGEDYHNFMKDVLHKLAAELANEYQNKYEYRVCVDTSPIMEKEFARLAGIGWQGKNAIIINQKHGSYFFLGEILTDQEADIYDQPIDDRCGTCTRCLDACPPKALSPYILDATLCTSYQTIEKKGHHTLKTDWNHWVYGCDICQQVCPWNNLKNQNKDWQLLFSGSHALDQITLSDILQLTDESFRLLFKKSAVKRAKRRGLIRNALYIWHQQPHLADITLVKNLLNDPDPEIQKEAKFALELIASKPNDS